MNCFTESNQLIFPNPKAWSEQIKEYTLNKRQLPYNNTPSPIKITHKDINASQNIFHPINQRYYDNDINDDIYRQEIANINKEIAKNYDNELRNEQTNNVINLQDKFKGFESHPNYPLSKSLYLKQNKEISKAPYNIISNHSLQDHHYNPPESRPLCLSEGNISEIKRKNQARDYSIINNRYCHNHEEKIHTEKEIEKYSAAQRFLNKHTYDLIKGRYYDYAKEAEYQHKKELEARDWGMNHHQYQSPLFNPVTHQIFNKKRLDEVDRKEMNKRSRFKLKEDIEDYYRKINYARDIKEENEKENHVSYYNYKIADERGYDILNHHNTFNKYKDSIGSSNKKHIKSNWEILTEKAGENQTYTSKGLYINKYDTSDININKHLYDQSRLTKINNLPSIANDPLFNQRLPFISKINNSMNKLR